MEVHLGRKYGVDEQVPLYLWTKGQQIQVHSIHASPIQEQPPQQIIDSTTVPQINPSKEDPDGKFFCHECDKHFTKKNTYLCHRRLHTDTKHFLCATCGKSFANKRNLLIHTRIHTGERPYNCEDCGKSFIQRSLLTVHKRIHTGERPFKCNVCDKAYYQNDHLTKHKRTHSGEKPYLCGECGKTFSDSSALRQHIRRHQGSRPFTCVLCKETFEKKYLLTIHNMVHKGLKSEQCDVCGKEFPLKTLLTSHRRVHFREKAVFSCNFCNKQFARAVTLKKHLKYFHGLTSSGRMPFSNDERPARKGYGENKPFQCNECGLVFTNNGKFLAHQQTHQSFKLKCDKCGMSFAKSYTLEIHQQMHATDSNFTAQTAAPTVTIPIVTLPVVNSVPSNMEIHSERREVTSFHGPTSTAGVGNENNLGVVKIVSLHPLEGDVKTELHCDPLAIATAAAQLTTTDLVENFTLFDQPSYTYYVPAHITTTVAEMDSDLTLNKDKQ